MELHTAKATVFNYWNDHSFTNQYWPKWWDFYPKKNDKSERISFTLPLPINWNLNRILTKHHLANNNDWEKRREKKRHNWLQTINAHTRDVMRSECHWFDTPNVVFLRFVGMIVWIRLQFDSHDPLSAYAQHTHASHMMQVERKENKISQIYRGKRKIE